MLKIKTAYILLVLLITVVSGMAQTIRINEFMASNTTTLQDNNNEYSDWIELYNPSTNAVSLLNWSLTDDVGNKQKWKFPDVTLGASQYLIIFASGKDSKGAQLHTNFKLDAAGEYLALVNPQGDVVNSFDPAYPAQSTDVSFSFFENEYAYTLTPSPGKLNIISGGDGQFLPSPEFSHTLGFYESPFNVSLTSSLTNGEIIYTTDGSEPSATNSTLYTATIAITTTTVVRAALKKSNNLIGPISTQTYLFIDDVIRQPHNPSGYPDMWGPYTALPGNAIADYEMDPEITQDPKYASKMKEALLSIPTLSIVTDADNLFSKDVNENTGGIYIYTGAPGNSEIPETGKGWERPASIEFFKPNGTKEFQVNCGIRLHGGHSRRPEKSPKHSFRIVFKDQYGTTRLNYPLFGDSVATRFDSFVLRAGFGNTIYHWNQGERLRMQHVRDLWAKDTQLAMGHPSGHGRHVHLYINGLYWGIYNPTEYLDEEFAESYFGGNADDYDIIKDYAEITSGNGSAWNELIQRVEQDLTDDGNYQRLLGNNPDGTRNLSYSALIDPENLADYMILNFYGGNTDWDHHNWVAIRNRLLTDKGFIFFSWDAEHVLKSLSANNVNEDNDGRPSHIFRRMLGNAEFRKLFANRVQLHCYNGGALTPARVEQIWLARSNEIEKSIVAETARWGDYRRDVHPYATEGPFQLYTYDDWLKEKSFLVTKYFPARTAIFIEQLKTANLFPQIDAPELFLNNKPITDDHIVVGDKISMTSSTGIIYYSINGSDPILGNGTAYASPLTLSESTTLKARTLSGNQWSALTDKSFFISNDFQNLKITEIHYHPLDEQNNNSDEFEFIEFKNVGETPIDLAGISLAEGITFKFPNTSLIKPGAFIVLASNVVQFNKRYKKSAYGEFQGHLDNAGETISLFHKADKILSIKYDDKAPWPEAADGMGYSIVPTEFNPSGDQNNPVKWRASLNIHGSPSRDDELITGIEENNINKKNILLQNYPNPFNRSTTIPYDLSSTSFVDLKIFDVLGREIITLAHAQQEPGIHNIPFAPENLQPGIYIYQLKTDAKTERRRMILVK